MVKRVTEEQAFGYFHAMAYAYYRLDRKAEAKAAAATCRKYAKTPEQIERLDQLVEALNYVPHVPVLSEDRARGGESDPPPPRLRRREALAVAEGTLKQIRIEYEAQEGTMPGTVGVVRGIEFLE